MAARVLRFLSCIALVSSALAASPRIGRAAWPEPAGQNLRISDTISLADCVAASDGTGGFFLAYQATRDATTEIRLRHYGASGVSAWAPLDVVLRSATGLPSWLLAQVLPDGHGGAFVSWREAGAQTTVRVQRVTANGTLPWATSVEVVRTPTGATPGTMALDGAGGVVIGWVDSRWGYTHPFAQRIDANGAALWARNGVDLTYWGNDQTDVQVVQLASGGWFVGWSREYFGSYVWDHCVISPSGEAGNLQTSPAGLFNTVVAAEGDAVWRVYRVDAPAPRLYAERLTGGATQFRRTISQAGALAQDPHAVTDGAGGLLVGWYDARLTSPAVWVQHLLPGDGAPEWTADGVAVTTGAPAGAVGNVRLAAGAAGQAMVAWTVQSEYGSDPWAAIVRADGHTPYAPTRLSSAANDQRPFAAVPLGEGASWAVLFVDAREGACSVCDPLQVRAQNVDQWGERGEPAPVLVSVRDVAADQGGRVRVSWNASPLELRLPSRVAGYRVWRSVPVTAALRAAGAATLTRDPAEAARTGAQLVGPFATAGYAWEFVAQTPAARLATYGLTTVTTNDSSAAGNPRTTFLVEAVAGDGAQWFSAPDSGYSVDNLAPPAPPAFTARWNGATTRLSWRASTAPDLAGYRLHRGTSLDFVPDDGNRVAIVTDTSYMDDTARPWIYKLVALDTHDNASPVVIALPAGVTDAAAPAARYAFAAPAPNPARGALTLRWSLPRDARVTLRVFDAAGRVVRTLADEAQPAGEQALTWDTRDDDGRRLPPGLYLARLECAGERALVRRVVVAD